MVTFFKRPAEEDELDARIAVLSRRGQPLANPPDPPRVPVPPVTQDNRRATAPEITGSTVLDIAPVVVPDIDRSEAPTPLPTAVSVSNLSEEDRSLHAPEENDPPLRDSRPRLQSAAEWELPNGRCPA